VWPTGVRDGGEERGHGVPGGDGDVADGTWIASVHFSVMSRLRGV
jgi:hypothetical protein